MVVYSVEVTSTAAILSESKNATLYTALDSISAEGLRNLNVRFLLRMRDCVQAEIFQEIRTLRIHFPSVRKRIEYDPMLGFQCHVLRKSSSFLHVNSLVNDISFTEQHKLMKECTYLYTCTHITYQSYQSYI